jgi:hypothetical protein
VTCVTDVRAALHGCREDAVAYEVKGELVSLRYAEHLLRSGRTGDEVIASLSVEFGLESVDAIATTAAAILVHDRLPRFHD